MDNYPDRQPNVPPVVPPIESSPSNDRRETLPAIQSERIVSPESAVATGSTPPLINNVPPVANPMPPIPQPFAQQYAVTPPSAPVPNGEDKDLIPKEWVIKAKRIVERTRSDPFEQSQEFNKLKAEYIKQRYNMVIKVNDQQ
jgi:hypothetical protein